MGPKNAYVERKICDEYNNPSKVDAFENAIQITAKTMENKNDEK